MIAVVIFSIVLMLAGGVALGLVIGYTAKVFSVEADPRVEAVAEMLPGANCGACGRAGCADLAKAIVEGKGKPSQCPVCPSAARRKIADFLGVALEEAERKVAAILCGGGRSKTKNEANYNGVLDCVSASLVAGGPKGCAHGCLGFATCARECPFNAIEVRDGLAVVHADVCVGCGKCVGACPRGLIRLVPASAGVGIYCNSPEKGGRKKDFCSVSCIGCQKCVKKDGAGRTALEGFLARINYSDPPGPEIIEAAGCPTGCLRAPEFKAVGEVSQ